MCKKLEVFAVYSALSQRLSDCGFHIPHDDPSKRRLTQASRGTCRDRIEAHHLENNFYARVHVSLHPANQAHPEDQGRDSICVTFTLPASITMLPADAARLIEGLELAEDKVADPA